jgi:serine phosphatase RsbU (regulator of sigma subunit)
VPDDALLADAGSLRAAYEAVDWASTPLGPGASWSPALRRAVELALQTRFPVTLFWGPELVLVYNEAYVDLIADKHPAALGTPARDVFPEAWDVIGPMMEDVLAGRGATWVEDASVPLLRNGILEEAYFTFSYSPVRGEGGAIEGVLDIATETTRQVIDRRRLQLLSRLGNELSGCEHAEDVPRRALPVLRGDGEDLPEVAIRLPGMAPDQELEALPGAPATPAGGADLVLEDAPGGRVAWLPLAPPTTGSPPLLVVRLSPNLAADDTYLGFLRLIASGLAQALDRIGALGAERALGLGERRMLEALQRSLLTTPPAPEGLEIAVRYEPAAEQAQIGGDWYDAFLLPDDTLTVVVGDVAGHDQASASAMAQVRNLLRGVAYTLLQPPAAVLSGLDGAMHGLSADVSASAVLAQVDRVAGGSGGRRLRWSNAGHPPPVLLEPDGSARLLATEPDVLLGVALGERADQGVPLAPGASLVLYTDGLVERRGVHLQTSLSWLTGVLEGQQALTAEELGDHVMGELQGVPEDDVALLVLRVQPS